MNDILPLLPLWAPDLARGFSLNILMSVVATLLATLLGALLGTMQCSSLRAPALAASWLTQLLRASPPLVVVFYIMYLLPFEVSWLGGYYLLPDWLKASVGLALPACGYMSEIVRGAIRAIPLTQWEAAAALALDSRQSLRRVIVPQALRSMLPPWMNLYCMLTMGTSLASLLGVEELMLTLEIRLSGETRPDLLLPAYGLTFGLFFLYIYPLSLWSRRLEARLGHYR
ncbi:ABC transporter permease subunit [Pseudomonas sp. LRF_L74]|uniref:ABC transporter permease subunit n=1 Tax=Pseudomonas sp. LRF_L74 TaxID=3369422 RepID=UPI003F605F5C